MTRARTARRLAVVTAGASALYAFSTRRRPEKTTPMADSATPQQDDPPARTLIDAATTGTPVAQDVSSDPSDPAGRTLIAAATTGSTAAQDPPPAPAPPDHEERAFCLRRGEPIAEGLRRAARGQLADSATGLAGVTDRDELGEAVHSSRKSIERVRATLRLSRDAIGEETYQHENAQLRTIAGRLSGARDAHVLIDTLRGLEERYPDELSPPLTERLHARLEDDHTRAISAMADDGDLAVTTRQALEDAHARTAAWSFEQDGLRAVQPGLRRAYRRGRRQLRAAREQPSAENLHDVRKRVKDLWHASELLHEAHPKRMRRLARDAHELSGLLGDHHDLSVLRDLVAANPQLFADMAARELLLAAIDRRRETLQRRALKLGRQVYKTSPKRLVKDIARGWDKRASSTG